MSRRNVLALIGIFFASLVLRPPVAAVGPLIPEITGKLGLSASQVGILTAIPVLCFGIGAFAGPAIVRRIGLDRTLFLLLGLIVASIALRAWFGYPSLLVGTTVVGLAIAVANVILPSIVRDRFPKQIALITAGYTLVLSISASGAASIAVPVSSFLGGWQFSLIIWVVPAALGFLVWSTQIREPFNPLPAEHHKAESRSVLRSPITWALVVFFGFQSLGFYALLGWLPSLLIDRGLTPDAAGALLGLSTIVGVPTGITLAANLGRFKSLVIPAVITSSITLTGMVLLLTPYSVLAVVVIGFGQAATFPISLNLISTRATTAAQTTSLSAISQGVGYILAALGTFAFGWLRDLTGEWTAPIVLLIALTLVQVLSGALVGRPKKIENPVT
ncbi:MAG: hypothetical protein RLZ71_277 [Actinomycetota bacterium]|jgi:CP family cyanate transporter-like MFS transporter